MNSIFVKDSTMVLLVDEVLEWRRARLFMPLLTRYAKNKKAAPFDYEKYEALSVTDRCFDNAIRTAHRYGLVYMEGIVIFDIIPMGSEPSTFPLAHGWCEDRQGNIIDPTMHKNQHSSSITYYGVPIRKDYADAWEKRMGYHGSLDGVRDGSPVGPRFESPRDWYDTRGLPYDHVLPNWNTLPKG